MIRPNLSHPGRRRDAGTVLVEALVATAVIAMMLAVTYRAVADSVLRSRAAEMSRSAVMIAQSRLAAVGGEIPLEPGETVGAEGGFTWRIRIDATPQDASGTGRLWSVTAAVRDRRGAADRAVLHTLRLGPAG